MQRAPRRALVIVNRQSLRGDADLALGLDYLRSHGLDLTAFPTDSPGEIPGLLRAHSQGQDLAILGGGDGTMNVAAEALVDCGLPLGILPMGTANDLARTLGIPSSLQQACEIIAQGHVQPIDLGKVNGKYFFNVASLGLAAEVPRYHQGERKKRWKLLSYPLSVIDAFRATGSFRAEVICDGRRRRLRCIQIAVGNGRHYGGGMTVAEDAAIDDEALDLYILRPQSLSQLIALGPALRFGKHGASERVVTFRGQDITVRTSKPKPINADGELVSETPARFTVKAKALRVIVSPNYVGWQENGADMLRNDLEVALVDLDLALRETAEGYASAADIIDDSRLSSLFKELGSSRRAAASALDACQRELGYVPKAPDEEKVLLREVVTQVKAIVSADERITILEERRLDEERIQTCTKAILKLDLPETLQTIASDIDQGTEEALDRLEELREDLVQSG